MQILKLITEWLVKSWLIGKDPDAGKDRRQEEKGATEDKIVGWHHQDNGHEFEQAPGVGDGQGSLACCSAWSHKESDTTEPLNNYNTGMIPRYTSRGNAKPSSKNLLCPASEKSVPSLSSDSFSELPEGLQLPFRLDSILSCEAKGIASGKDFTAGNVAWLQASLAFLPWGRF